MKSSVVLAMYIGKSLQRRGKQIGERHIIITAVENPNERERNEVLVRLAKNAIALPIPVDIPANDVRKNAISTG